ncbi:hypothetical protein [Bradyrhizobium sp.]|uniref:hypothetical protein n=1 Tax=Bradyrhizobium sp. TaxID=376 RepID=UPI003C72BCD7
MKLKIITATALAILFAAPASAGPLNNIWHHQQVRIGNGIASGRLTPVEAIGLEAREAFIRGEARFLRATGGGLSPAEKGFLRSQLAAASGAIRYHKHN